MKNKIKFSLFIGCFLLSAHSVRNEPGAQRARTGGVQRADAPAVEEPRMEDNTRPVDHRMEDEKSDISDSKVELIPLNPIFCKDLKEFENNKSVLESFRFQLDNNFLVVNIFFNLRSARENPENEKIIDELKSILESDLHRSNEERIFAIDKQIAIINELILDSQQALCKKIESNFNAYPGILEKVEETFELFQYSFDESTLNKEEVGQNIIELLLNKEKFDAKKKTLQNICNRLIQKRPEEINCEDWEDAKKFFDILTELKS